MNHSDMNMTLRLMFRLLPIQILLAAVGAVNGIVTGLFASNALGEEAISAVGLYNPLQMFVGAVSAMLVGGATILCGQYMGRNMHEKTQDIFSLDILISLFIGLLISLVLLGAGLFTSCSFITKDPVLQPIFRTYLLGQLVGIIPSILGSQLAAFLSLENKTFRTTAASIIYIIVNVILNFLFLNVFRLDILGLALASSLGMCIFCAAEAQYFFTKKASLHFRFSHPAWSDGAAMFRIGVPGSMTYVYQAIRGVIVNSLLLAHVGQAGIAAFAASNTLMNIFWSIPAGMLAVSRMMMNISIGEEDRQTLTDIMRVAVFRYIPVMCAVSACIILLAVPETQLYFHDPADPVFAQTVSAFRILPLCMPLSIIYMVFSCYYQSSGRTLYVHILSLIDGVISVVCFTALTIRVFGIRSVYIANVFNGTVTTILIIGYAWMKNKHMPRNMDELMVIPADFGVIPEERMDISVRSTEEVVTVSQQVHEFCRSRGLDEKRSYYAGLFLEEMAGNVVEHGFTKDKKKHSVDIRVVHKGDDVIMRIRDDCIPFDPAERAAITDPDDITKNIGIRMVYKMTDRIEHQNILGLNVLTIRI